MAEVDVFLSDGRYDDAKALLAERLDKNPLDRESKLYLLLVNVILNGPAVYENDIDQLRSLSNFSDIEKEIVRRVFILGFESAKKEEREDQAWAYQRLSRRLLLNQRLDQPIPKSGHHPRLGEHPLARFDKLKSDRARDRAISRRRLITISPKMYLMCLKFCRPALRMHQLPTWKPMVSRQTALIALSVGLLITPILYVLAVHRQTPDDSPISTRAVPTPAPHSVLMEDIIGLSRRSEARAADAEAKAKPPSHIISSTVLEERKSPLKADQQLSEPKTPKMVVGAATDLTKSEESLADTIVYETLRITPLRQEPRFAATATEDIDPGTAISVLEKEGDWLKIKARTTGSVGYVRKEYVAPLSPP
jgi:hypothetical protein